MNEAMSSYASHLFDRFVSGTRDGSIQLNGIDEKASLNDQFFALQQHLHENNNRHRSDAVPKKEFATLKLQIKSVVKAYLKRCGVEKSVIDEALKSITTDGGPDEATAASDTIFIWVCFRLVSR